MVTTVTEQIVREPEAIEKYKVDLLEQAKNLSTAIIVIEFWN